MLPYQLNLTGAELQHSFLPQQCRNRLGRTKSSCLGCVGSINLVTFISTLHAPQLTVAAARLTQRQQKSQLHIPETRLQEYKWFEKTSYNTAAKHLKSWPAKHLVDLVHYSGQVRTSSSSTSSSTDEYCRCNTQQMRCKTLETKSSSMRSM